MGALASLRPQALLEFGLPAAPQRVDELPLPLSEVSGCRVHTPAGRFLLLCCEAPLRLAFEATLFDLLADARFPAAPPRRSQAGSLIANLSQGPAKTAAACFPWPPGEQLQPGDATVPQLLELGRLLARLHQLAETHPASVADPHEGPALAARLPAGARAERLAAVLRAPPEGLPSGAVHGSLGPGQAAFIGDRCSGILPGGRASAGALAVDLAECAAGWALPLPNPAPALRGVISGYQAVRRLSREEREALFSALRFAAARQEALRLCAGQEGAALLDAAEALGEAQVREAAG